LKICVCTIWQLYLRVAFTASKSLRIFFDGFRIILQSDGSVSSKVTTTPLISWIQQTCN
jgi:hypothetical protein